MINISETAKEYLEDMIGLGLSGRYARVSVEDGGCSGFQYCWDLVNDDTGGTLVDNILLVDKLAEKMVEGCTIDYVLGFAGASLVVKNPNVTASCGCGESFAV